VTLKNVSSNFKTSFPEKLEKVDPKICLIDKDYIYFDGNLIKLENRFSHYHYAGIEFDLIYNLLESSVAILKPSKYKFKCEKNGESISKSLQSKQQSFNLKKEGALILGLQ
jgi:hypothetical protein